MRISRITITNFRNFRNFDIQLGEHAVIVGENSIGKSNLLYALRLILDPSLPDTARQLRREDFWDGIETLTADDEIRIAIEFSEFDENDDHLALLGGHLCSHDPMEARLTYVFRAKPDLEGNPVRDADYHYFLFGGDEEDRTVTNEVRRRLPLEVLPALRDPENALMSRSRSPLTALLDEAIALIDNERRQELAEAITDAADSVGETEEIAELAQRISSGYQGMVGETNSLDLDFGFTAANAERLFKGLRLFIDGRKRMITEASLGSANALYLSLKVLELDLLAEQNVRDHTFLAIEEPESHLHPQMQRLVYRHFLRSRSHQPGGGQDDDHIHATTKLMTTHSPHVVSVAPLDSLVLLKRNSEDGSTIGSSTAITQLTENEIDDLERYLEVKRGEIVFAKAVLLVEGPSEEYVIAALADKLGKNLEERGVVICSVDGTNFSPFVKLLGPASLNIPYAILTDYDPQVEDDALSVSRVCNLLSLIDETIKTDDLDEEGELWQTAEEHGIFVNDYTFEIDLFRGGRRMGICNALRQLSENQALRARMSAWRDSPDTLDEEQFLKDVKTISKGRLGQRLSSRILSRDSTGCPGYIENGIDYLIERI